MKGKFRPIKSGESFYLFKEYLHYIGIAESKDEKVHVFWGWNKFKKWRYYKVIRDDDLAEYWQYFRKNKKK